MCAICRRAAPWFEEKVLKPWCLACEPVSDCHECVTEKPREWGRVPEMSLQEVGAWHGFIESKLLVTEPAELKDALRDDGMLLDVSWVFVAKYLDVVFSRLRREGYDIPLKFSRRLVERAMALHEGQAALPRTNEDLCEGLAFTEASALKLGEVVRYGCEECGAPGELEQNWPRRFIGREEKDPYSFRWCAKCWRAWQEQWSS